VPRKASERRVGLRVATNVSWAAEGVGMFMVVPSEPLSTLAWPAGRAVVKKTRGVCRPNELAVV
jgi:hypothetical protein